jgi:hypothetical protein
MTKEDLKNMAWIVIPSVIILLFGVFVVKPVGGLVGYVSGVLYIATAINQKMGLNIWLARLIAIPFFVFGYYYGIRYILFSRKNRKKGYLALIVVWSAICLSMFATQGSFSREDGEALKFYFRDDRGQIVLREHSGVDADTGAKLQQITPEIMREYRLEQEGVLEVTDNTLFDPESGKALKRFYQAENGTISLFPLEVEFHPQYGAKLEIITPEIAGQYAKQSGHTGLDGSISLVPEEQQHETASAEEIARVNREYQQRVSKQLETRHDEHEQASQEDFDDALEQAATPQDGAQ